MESIYISIIEKIKEGFPGEEGFSYRELKEKSILTDGELDMVGMHLHNALSNLRSNVHSFLHKESMFVPMSPEDTGGLHKKFLPVALKEYEKDKKHPIYNRKFALSLDSEFKFIEYQELKEARKYSSDANKNAHIANRHAMLAVKIAVVGILLTAVITVCTAIFLNTIRIEEGQFTQLLPSYTNSSVGNVSSSPAY